MHRAVRSATTAAVNRRPIALALAAAALAACGAPLDADPETAATELRAAPNDTVHTAVGGLRRVGATETYCTVTLIHPRVALTAAHCLAALAHRCQTDAAARAGFEVVFTTGVDFRDPAQVVVRRAAAIAIHPLAVQSPVGACATAPFVACDDAAGLKRGIDAAYDVALIRLDQPVPTDVIRPITAVTNAFAARPDGVTTTARLDDPTYGPAFRASPAATVVGFGVNDVCGDHRAGGEMFFTGANRWWRRACRDVLRCDGSVLYSASERDCVEGSASVGPLIRVGRGGARFPQGATTATYSGVYTASGDSGGPLIVSMVPGPGRARQELVIGVLHGSLGSGAESCRSAPDDRYHESLYAPTFGVPTGAFIEAQLFFWLDVRAPRVNPFGL